MQTLLFFICSNWDTVSETIWRTPTICFFFFLTKFIYLCQRACCCSIATFCWILWDPVDYSMSVSSVLHYLPDFAQIHIHWWCHLIISSSIAPFSSFPQSYPASGSFPVSQFFTSGGQNIGASASASVLPMNIQDWFLLGWIGWISWQPLLLIPPQDFMDPSQEGSQVLNSLITTRLPAVPRLILLRFSPCLNEMPPLVLKNTLQCDDEAYWMSWVSPLSFSFCTILEMNGWKELSKLKKKKKRLLIFQTTSQLVFILIFL